jgi:hypothetical protein
VREGEAPAEPENVISYESRIISTDHGSRSNDRFPMAATSKYILSIDLYVCIVSGNEVYCDFLGSEFDKSLIKECGEDPMKLMMLFLIIGSLCCIAIGAIMTAVRLARFTRRKSIIESKIQAELLMAEAESRKSEDAEPASEVD